jgi:hypothetical protein
MATPLTIFERGVFDTFGSLTSVFGLPHVRSVIHVPEIAIFFENNSLGLAVKFEIGMTPWVEFAHILRDHGGRIVAKERCGLDFILAERSQLEPRLSMPLETVDDPRLIDILEELARRVQQYAPDVLRGDFAIFEVCRQRQEEKLRRTEEELYRSRTKD